MGMTAGGGVVRCGDEAGGRCNTKMDSDASSSSGCWHPHPAAGSFSSLGSYRRALLDTPRRIRARALHCTSPEEELGRVRARSGPELRRSLRWADLIGLGLGGMIGAGIFVASGHAARDHAGPAVVLSYAVAGLCSLLSALCYTELAVELPAAGGAFSYLRVTFGELPALVTGANLLIEYVFSNAAVARSLTGYLGTAAGVAGAADRWRVKVSGLPHAFDELDFLAVAVIIIVSICICRSTKGSSVVNMALTALHIVFLLFIIILGFLHGDPSNFTRPGSNGSSSAHGGGFFPYGAAGVFGGAALVYMSYIGYDAVSTMAEEVRDPARDIPVGIAGSVAAVTVLYCLVAASMCMLLPYDKLDPDDPFSGAFAGVASWGWASNVIGAGASLGILTSLVVAMLGQTRYLCVIARSGLAPSFLARVHPVTATPINAAAVLGLLTAALSLFTDLAVLLNLISISTLFVFYMVANAVVYRRYTAAATASSSSSHSQQQQGHSPSAPACSTVTILSFLLALSLSSLSFTLVWRLAPDGPVKAAILVLTAAAAMTSVLVFRLKLPRCGTSTSSHSNNNSTSTNTNNKRPPPVWCVPWMPWIPAASIFLNVFLLGCVDTPSYVRFAVFTALVFLFYFLYAVHATFDAQQQPHADHKMPHLQLQPGEDQQQQPPQYQAPCEGATGHCAGGTRWDGRVADHV